MLDRIAETIHLKELLAAFILIGFTGLSVAVIAYCIALVSESQRP